MSTMPKLLDDLQQLAENKATRTGKVIEKPAFPKGKDARGRRVEERFAVVRLSPAPGLSWRALR
jgi:hypothetical protein